MPPYFDLSRPKQCLGGPKPRFPLAFSPGILNFFPLYVLLGFTAAAFPVSLSVNFGRLIGGDGGREFKQVGQSLGTCLDFFAVWGGLVLSAEIGKKGACTSVFSSKKKKTTGVWGPSTVWRFSAKGGACSLLGERLLGFPGALAFEDVLGFLQGKQPRGGRPCSNLIEPKGWLSPGSTE